MSGLADLHRHLDGSLRPQTVAELADTLGKPVPEKLRFHANMGLDEALARFAYTLSLLSTSDAVRRIADELCEDAIADGVTTLEIRFAPQLHGPPIEEVVDAAVDGIAGRAGLILCGLYGEDPQLVHDLVELAASRAGVVGIDIAGGPTPGHSWGLEEYAPAFDRARDLGLGRTVHAGEGRPASEIRTAIDKLHAQRIGHGISLLDDPSVVQLVIDRNVTIEACPTSNVHTGVIASVADHPISEWLDRGVRVCVCTDNTLLSDVVQSEELSRVRAIAGMTDDKIARVVRYGHDAAFGSGYNQDR